MTVFIAHAPEDRAAAESLETAIERRGQFAELEDGSVAQRPLQASDVFVLMVSQKLSFATARLRLERRALDAWAEAKLVVVKLDHGIAPVGLRDLPMIDASFEAQREFAWMKVADAIAALLRPPAPQARAPSESVDHAAPGGVGAPQPQPRNKKNGGAGKAAFVSLAVLLGLAALATSAAIWLVNRIGSEPGGWNELIAGINAFGARAGLAPGLTPLIFALAIAMMILAPLLALATRNQEPKAPPAASGVQADAPAPAPMADAIASATVFVSYARANQGAVLPVIEAARERGQKLWVDQQGGIHAGEGWAGEIVRAIRDAAGVVVMCSKAAFESDHVKREIYLADRYHKRLVPVFIEHAEPPEDFEYFFAGVQHLNLFETPEADRPQAFIAVLG